MEKNISLIGKIKRPRKEKDGAQKNKTTATILTARLFRKTRVMKPRLQASKRVVSQSTSSKRNLRKEEKAKLNRGQKKS